ncbi:MAG: rhamnulokinase [Chloroflexales bacterium]|nr:rhamnulokinase [Chloroflexales bacterium]
MPIDHFLAVDLGASGGRVMLGRWDGARISIEPLTRFENGPIAVHNRQHWDILGIWNHILAGIRTHTSRGGAPLAGISVDSWGVDYGLLDSQGRLIANPTCYRDHRTDGMLEQAFARVSSDDIFATTGIQFMQINTLYQLLSMRLSQDPQLSHADKLLLVPDLLHYWMSGVAVAEYTNASTTQMLDCHTRDWASDMLARLDIPRQMLPKVIMPGTILGPLLASVCADTGLTSAPPVIAGATHDTGAAIAAIPGLDPHSAYISSGTWSLMGMEIAAPVVSATARAVNFTNEGGINGTIRLLKNIAGLWLLQECRRSWQRQGHEYSWDELMALASGAPAFASVINPDAHDFLNPDDMPSAIQNYCQRNGITVPQTPGALVRCCLESLALRYRTVLDTLSQLSGNTINTVRIVGGGSQNQLLNRFTADACNLPVVAGPVEATALGNVLIQAITIGVIPDLATGRRIIAESYPPTIIEPSAQRAAWDAQLPRFQQLPA